MTLIRLSRLRLGMLLDGLSERRTTPRLPRVLSIVVHLLAIAALIYRPAPRFLKASPSLRGAGGRGNVIALATPGVSALAAPPRAEQEEPRRLTPPRKSRAAKAAPPPARAVASDPQALLPGMPGFVLGSLTDGFASNHDVRAAISIVAPDPPIARSKLPQWIRGDVIVEVTIDEQGNVIATKVLQTVGFGLDQVIVETLRQWRYIPARVDGVAVASREDVHFHFPS